MVFSDIWRGMQFSRGGGPSRVTGPKAITVEYVPDRNRNTKLSTPHDTIWQAFNSKHFHLQLLEQTIMERTWAYSRSLEVKKIQQSACHCPVFTAIYYGPFTLGIFAAISRRVKYWRFRSDSNQSVYRQTIWNCDEIALEIAAKIASVNGPLQL